MGGLRPQSACAAIAGDRLGATLEEHHMPGLPTAFPRAAFTAPRRFVLAAALLPLLVVACSASAASPTPGASVAGASGEPSAAATASAVESAASATIAATPTAAATATPVPTPLPALAVGLCRGSQLKLAITAWYGDTGTAYAHVTATNKSSSSCNMRGFSEARILNGHGSVIGDAGSSAASVRSTDPIYPLAPGAGINTIVQWGNWCKSNPAQKVTVSMVQPFGLGVVTAPANGNAPIPTCYQASQPTQVSSEAWLP
jgi:hypothetical protein